MAYGSAGYGSAYGTTVVSGDRVFSVSRTSVSSDGGDLVEFYSGLDDGVYAAYFGPYGSTEDLKCYGGDLDLSGNVSIINGATKVWVPPARRGSGGFHFELVSGSGASTIDTGLIFEITGFAFRYKLLELRGLFGPKYRTGYRNSDEVALQE